MNENVVELDSPLILVVDDDEGARTLWRKSLERRGYRVEEATDGREALSAYERVRPHGVLLDCVMPGMDGFETCARLQTLPGGDRTPVLMVTALEDPEAIARAFEAGAADYLTKPLHMDVLYYRLRRLLRAARAEEAVRSAHADLEQIFNSSADGLRVVDRDFSVTKANRTFLALSGATEVEVLGKKCYETFSGSACHTAKCPLARILKGEERIQATVEKTRVDGTVVLCAAAATPFRASDGTVTGIVESYRDITERTRLEDQVRQQERMAAFPPISSGIHALMMSRTSARTALVMNTTWAFMSHGISMWMMTACVREAAHQLTRFVIFRPR